jgi:SAM-dependent methyltransferase
MSQSALLALRITLDLASRRNAAAIAAGRVSLARAPVDQLPPSLGGPFDAILAVSSLGFWPAPTQQLQELRRRLRPGGRIAVASQPRCPGATASTSRKAAREIQALLQDAGYTKPRTETLDLDPPVVCILAVNPDPARDRSSPASDPTSRGWCSKGEYPRYVIELPCQRTDRKTDRLGMVWPCFHACTASPAGATSTNLDSRCGN